MTRIAKIFAAFQILIICSTAMALPYFIWNPIGSSSGDDLHRVFQSAQYSGRLETDLGILLGNLDQYEPLFIISEFGEPGNDYSHVADSLLALLQDQLTDYLIRGGSLYWEGVGSIERLLSQLHSRRL